SSVSVGQFPRLRSTRLASHRRKTPRSVTILTLLAILATVVTSSVDASQGSDRDNISFDSDPSNHSSFGSGSSGRWYGSTVSSGSLSSEDDLVNRHFAGTFPPPML
ncbi:hypothetical protein PIB30_090769, partial [Stylosanthes scabra]|nr:hypothetical protein [Stylosanthes scabra]